MTVAVCSRGVDRRQLPIGVDDPPINFRKLSRLEFLMTALTPLDKVTFDHRGRSAWVLLLRAEQSALTKTRSTKNSDPLIGVRVLGHLLEDFWKHQSSCLGIAPHARMIEEINSCRVPTGFLPGSDENAEVVNEKLSDLGLLYRNYMFHSAVNDMVNAPAPATKPDVKGQALFRDGHQCVVTGLFDSLSCKAYPAVEAERVAKGALRLNTEAVHIFSESAQDDEKPQTYDSKALAFLKLFGLGEVVDRILGGNVHSLFNLNTYDVCGPHADDRHAVAVPPLERITFRISPEVEEACKEMKKWPCMKLYRAGVSRVELHHVLTLSLTLENGRVFGLIDTPVLAQLTKYTKPFIDFVLISDCILRYEPDITHFTYMLTHRAGTFVLPRDAPMPLAPCQSYHVWTLRSSAHPC
ncbi:hypothetical protein DXG01_008900 [Tephrocybe rancida]|nr:hypothetical protein DXG01_008900 [Tephrocybe rancida]